MIHVPVLLAITYIIIFISVQHISSVTGQAFHHIRDLRVIRKVLGEEGNTCADLISSHLHYCNTLLIGFPGQLLQRRQYVQNAAAIRIAQKWKYDYVNDIRRALHGTPVKKRIEFNILVQAYMDKHTLSLAYLSEMIIPFKSIRRLRLSGY